MSTWMQHDVGSATDWSSGALKLTLEELRTRCKVVRLIGAGAFAEVYKVVFDNQPAALKVLHLGKHTKEETVLFFREARALRICNHSNIVSFRTLLLLPPNVRGIGNKTERWAILQELLEGESVARIITSQLQEPFRRLYSQHEAVSWCRDLALALAYLHEKGLVHRDVKPDNIVICRKDGAGTAKLTDFGLHRIIEMSSDKPFLRQGDFSLCNQDRDRATPCLAAGASRKSLNSEVSGENEFLELPSFLAKAMGEIQKQDSASSDIQAAYKAHRSASQVLGSSLVLPDDRHSAPVRHLAAKDTLRPGGGIGRLQDSANQDWVDENEDDVWTSTAAGASQACFVPDNDKTEIDEPSFQPPDVEPHITPLSPSASTTGALDDDCPGRFTFGSASQPAPAQAWVEAQRQLAQDQRSETGGNNSSTLELEAHFAIIPEAQEHEGTEDGVAVAEQGPVSGGPACGASEDSGKLLFPTLPNLPAIRGCCPTTSWRRLQLAYASEPGVSPTTAPSSRAVTPSGVKPRLCQPISINSSSGSSSAAAGLISPNTTSPWPGSSSSAAKAGAFSTSDALVINSGRIGSRKAPVGPRSGSLTAENSGATSELSPCSSSAAADEPRCEAGPAKAEDGRIRVRPASPLSRRSRSHSSTLERPPRLEVQHVSSVSRSPSQLGPSPSTGPLNVISRSISRAESRSDIVPSVGYERHISSSLLDSRSKTMSGQLLAVRGSVDTAERVLSPPPRLPRSPYRTQSYAGSAASGGGADLSSPANAIMTSYEAGSQLSGGLSPIARSRTSRMSVSRLQLLVKALESSSAHHQANTADDEEEQNLDDNADLLSVRSSVCRPTLGMRMANLSQDGRPSVSVGLAQALAGGDLRAIWKLVADAEETGNLDLVYMLTGCTGSCMYMAPEVYRRLPYNEKADVFSFGVVMYEILSRTLMLYTHGKDDSEGYCKRVVEGFRPPNNQSIPHGLWPIITSCWDAEPLARPDMDWVAECLQAWLDVEGANTEPKAPMCGCTIA